MNENTAANSNKNGDANRGLHGNARRSNEEEMNLLKKNSIVIPPPISEIDDGSCGSGDGIDGNGGVPNNDVCVAVIGDEVNEKNLKQYKLINKNKNSNKKNAVKGVYGRLLARYDISKKAENPFLLLTILSLLLAIVLIVLIILYPRVPSYMKADVCVDSECLEASKQLLSWSNIKADPCDNTYNWTCGQFEDVYGSHKFYGMNKGEWNFYSNREYEEIKEINEFISKLPSGALSYSAQAYIKQLHTDCKSLDLMDRHETITALRRAFKSIGGWRMIGQDFTTLLDVRKNLPLAQIKYGAAPFFKISIANKHTPPYDSIIKISEGDLGLPNKEFYSLTDRHPIIKAYTSLLQDTLRNLIGPTMEQTKNFADNILSYERRIARMIIVTTKEKGPVKAQLRTLNDIKKEAPSLPILDTVRQMFKSTKITEHTVVLVENLDALIQISQIVSTTDAEVLNNFVAWSLIREFLPYMSREFRVSLEEFNRVLYGISSKQPLWFYCTKIIQNWLSFGVEALRDNPYLIVHVPEKDKHTMDNYLSESLIGTPVNFGDELLKMIFHHIKNEYKHAVSNTLWFSERLSKYVFDKLSSLRFQIGIPDDVLKNETFLNENYNDFSLQTIQFIDNIENYWVFQKAKMDKMLGSMNENERIISELFPQCKNCRQPKNHMTYSSALNMIIISKEALREPYYSAGYPISMNFARIGVDISQLLHKAVYEMSLQYDISHRNPVNMIEAQAIKCFGEHDEDFSRKSNETIIKLFIDLSAGNMATKAMNTFINKVSKNERIFDDGVPEILTYDLLNLNTKKRQPGLQPYDEQQIFTLAYLQRHCAVIDESYQQFKILIEDDIPEREKFHLMWNHIPDMRKSLDCSSSKTKCDSLL